MSTAPPDPIMAAAQFLAARNDPRGWRQLLSDHVADAGGRCRACRSISVAAPVWPCGLRLIGEEAERLATAAAPGDVLNHPGLTLLDTTGT